MAFLSTLWTDFIERFDGPLHFRLLVQPVVYETGAGTREKDAAHTYGLCSPNLRNAAICSKVDGKESLKSLSSLMRATSSISLWCGAG
jgi:hypothetical protein